ncbi:Cubilin [Lamellibrachia satsuma]|nr:Cubilin [Lamellibrachia satsuma]
MVVMPITLPNSKHLRLLQTYSQSMSTKNLRPLCQPFLKLRDGTNERANLVGQYCGNRIPATYTSTTNTLWLKFKTDATNHGSGFRGTWQVACGGTFRSATGNIKSPYFPQAYPHSRECVYDILQPPNTATILSFTAFDIGTSEEGVCSDAGYLQVLDESGGVVPHRGRLCGSSLPPPLVATGNLKLKFVTDGSASSRGFHATYETNRRGATDESGDKGDVDVYKIPVRAS